MVLEVTERQNLREVPRWEESAAWLARQGFSVALDDLGAGFASLTSLADLDPAYAKLDMGLVRDIEARPQQQLLVRLLKTYGEASGVSVIAEGIETDAEVRTLLDCGVTLMQGYYFGRPTL